MGQYQTWWIVRTWKQCIRKRTRLCCSSKEGVPSPLASSAGTTVSSNRRKNDAKDGPVDFELSSSALPSDDIDRRDSQAFTFSRNFSFTICRNTHVSCTAAFGAKFMQVNGRETLTGTSGRVEFFPTRWRLRYDVPRQLTSHAQTKHHPRWNWTTNNAPSSMKAPATSHRMDCIDLINVYANYTRVRYYHQYRTQACAKKSSKAFWTSNRQLNVSDKLSSLERGRRQAKHSPMRSKNKGLWIVIFNCRDHWCFSKRLTGVQCLLASVVSGCWTIWSMVGLLKVRCATFLSPASFFCSSATNINPRIRHVKIVSTWQVGQHHEYSKHTHWGKYESRRPTTNLSDLSQFWTTLLASDDAWHS